MRQLERKYVSDKSNELGKLIKGINQQKKNFSIEDFFSCIVSDNVQIKWQDQMCRWGTSFFSSVLPNRVTPDYFLLSHDLSIGKNGTTIGTIWDNKISQIIQAIHEKQYKKIADIFRPKLTLAALKSSLIPNARLARYFINIDMLNTTSKRLSVPKSYRNPEKLFSSRYWQLAECVHGHLFGRKNFFSEMDVKKRTSRSLLIIITANEKLSLGYINYKKNTLYVDIKVAKLLGSELKIGNDHSVVSELMQMKEELARLCLSFLSDSSMQLEHSTPEYVHYRITQIAADIASEVRNMFDFDRNRDDRIGMVLDMLFAPASKTKEAMLNMQRFFEVMMPDRERQTLSERLKILLTSLFDLFMILPESKSYLFNYVYGPKEKDLGITWAIVGDGPDNEENCEEFNDTLRSLEKIYEALITQKSRIFASYRFPLEAIRRVSDSCERLQHVVSACAGDELPIDFATLLRKKFQLTEADKGLNALCLTLEACSYLTGEAHENSPLSFTFLISGSHAWHAFNDVISDSEMFEPEGSSEKKWKPEITAKMIKTNYSILQVPRVVAFFDRLKVWDEEGIRCGQIARLAESENNKGLIGYPFIYNSRWESITNWGKDDFIVEVRGMNITVLRGNKKTKGVEPFIEWDTKKNIILNLTQKDNDIRKYITSFIGDDHNGVLMKLVLDVLTTMSATPGEGTLIVFNSDDDSELKKCFDRMDNKEWEQLWRKKEKLIRYDRDTLRAALRMDGGARMIKGQNGSVPSDIEVSFRLSVRPNRLLNEKQREVLVGRGSRHHSAAALSLHFCPEKNALEKGEKAKGAVIVVSADGPITLLPYPSWYKE